MENSCNVINYPITRFRKARVSLSRYTYCNRWQWIVLCSWIMYPRVTGLRLWGAVGIATLSSPVYTSRLGIFNITYNTPSSLWHCNSSLDDNKLWTSSYFPQLCRPVFARFMSYCSELVLGMGRWFDPRCERIFRIVYGIESVRTQNREEFWYLLVCSDNSGLGSQKRLGK